MKRFTFLFGLLMILQQVNAQSLLNLNEYETIREENIEEELKKSDDQYKVSTEKTLEKTPFSTLGLGSNLTTGSDAIGFRPSIVASTNVVKGILGMSASIQFTQVDDQKFDIEKTGQTLFINETSNFSANLGFVVGVPNLEYWHNCKDHKDSIDPRFGFTGGIHLRGNSLFNLDSNTFRSEENDIFTLQAHLGLEIILMRDNVSVYCYGNYMGVTNNRDKYHAYFPTNAVKDFWYLQPGFKFLAAEGLTGFKGLVIDVSAIVLTEKMRVLAGYQNTLIPVIKIGYTQKIGWDQLKDNRKKR